MTRLRNIAFIASTFFALGAISLSFVDIYYYYVTIIIVLPLLFFKYRSIDAKLLGILTFLFLFGLLNVILGNNDFQSFIKNILGISLAYLFFFLIIKDSGFDLIRLFRLYYRFAIIFAAVGVIQFLSFLVGFKYGYNYSWLGLRTYNVEASSPYFFPVHSLTNEPSFFAFVQAPAVFIALRRLFKSEITIFGTKSQALLIIISYPLSQSSTGYFSLLLAVVLLNLKQITVKRLIVMCIGVPSLVFCIYSFVPKFQERLDSSIALMTGQIIIEGTRTGNANGSSLILFNHFLIAERNAFDHPLGTGVGSHHVAFRRYNSVNAWFTGYGPDSIELNIHDASSLFNRVLSEMGFLGIFAFFYFLVTHFLRTGPDDMVLVNQASFVIICTALLRNGHYFTFGLPFFLMAYYYSYMFAKAEVSKNEEKNLCKDAV